MTRRSFFESLEERLPLASDVEIGAIDSPGEYVRNVVGATVTYSPTSDDASIGATVIATDLAAGLNVIVNTVNGGGAQAGDIFITANVSKDSGGPASIDLRADNDVVFDGAADLTSQSGRLDVVLNADRDATGGGAVEINTGSTIDSHGGNITMGGGVAPLTTAAIGNAGQPVGITIGGDVNSTGGDISIRGTGISGGATAAAMGVQAIFGNVSAGDGDIAMIGVGGETSGDQNLGISVRSSSLTTSGGEITLTGTGGGTGEIEHGVFIDGSSVILTQSGDVSIIGTGSPTAANDSDGITLESGANQIAAEIDGDVTLTGVAGSGGRGLEAGFVGVDVIGTPTSSGNVTVNADQIVLNANAGTVLIQGSGNLAIVPLTPSATIGLGGGSGTLNLNDTELGFIADGFNAISIGDTAAGSGAVDINSATFLDPLTITGGAIIVADGMSGDGGITLTARDEVSGGQNIEIVSGLVTDHSRSITLDAGDDVTVSSGATIATTTSGATLNINVDQAVDPDAGTGSTVVVDGTILTDSGAYIHGGDDDAGDTFTITPQADSSFTVDGNNPTTGTGDSLLYNGSGNKHIAGLGTGQITAAGLQPIFYREFESINATGVNNTLTDVVDLPVDGNPNTLTLMRDSSGTLLQIFLDPDGSGAAANALISEQSFSSIEAIRINGSAEEDRLIVDSVNGLISVPNGIYFDGAGGFDTIDIVDTAAISAVQASETLVVGASPGDGVDIVASVVGEMQTIHFENIEPINSAIAAADLAITSLPGVASLLQDDNQITYMAGPGGAPFPGGTNTGLVTIDNFEPIQFANKANLILDAAQGDDTIVLETPASAPTGLSPAGITVNGGAGSDALTVSGIQGTEDQLTVTPTGTGVGSISEVAATQFRDVAYNGTETLVIAGQTADIDELNLADTAGDDTYSYTPGATQDAGQFTGQSSGAAAFAFPSLNFHGISGAVSVGVNAAVGVDTLVVNGTSGDDMMTVDGQIIPSDGLVTQTAIRAETGGVAHTTVFPIDLTQVILRGLEGNDTFHTDFSPLPGGATDIPIRIEGGDSDGSSDTIHHIADDGAATTIDLATRAITSTGANDVVFAGVETVNHTSNGANATLSVTGTVGDDRFTVQPAGPEDGNFSAMSRGSVVADYPKFTYAGVSGAFTISDVAGTGGTDSIEIIGDDAADAVTLTTTTATRAGGVVTLGASLETIHVSTGGGDDTLTVDVAGTDLIHQPMTYDGGSGGDTLVTTGVPSVTVNTETYTPGPEVHRGRLAFASTGNAMNIEFVNLEPTVNLIPSAMLVVNGTNQDNVIVYSAGPNSGQAAAPFNGAATGIVSIDGFETIEFANNTNLTVNGLVGNDRVELANTGAIPANLTGISVNGGLGNDHVDGSTSTALTPLSLNGDGGADTLIGGLAADMLNGGSGDDTLDGRLVSGAAGNDVYDGGAGFDSMVVQGTPGDDYIEVFQISATNVAGDNYSVNIRINATTDVSQITKTTPGNSPSTPTNLPTIEEIRIVGQQGNDLISVGHADPYINGDNTATGGGVPDQRLRIDVNGDDPNASDRLVVLDDEIGDLVLIRQAPDERSGRVTLGPAVTHVGNTAVGAANTNAGDIIYQGIERLDISPLTDTNASATVLNRGTGSDGLGRIIVFEQDPFELNELRQVATDIHDVARIDRNPSIDPGAQTNQFANVPGDEDWYELAAAKTGTFRFDLLFDQIGTLANGRPGLPANGDLAAAFYDENGVLIASSDTATNNESLTISVAAGTSYYLRVLGTQASLAGTSTSVAINLYDVQITEVDTLGPQIYDPDAGGPLMGVHITENAATATLESSYNLFGLKTVGSAPPTGGPTPAISSLTINFRDANAAIAPGSPYVALDPTVAAAIGNYQIAGDQNGIIPIESVTVINDALTADVSGTQAPTATMFTAVNNNANEALSNVDDFYNGALMRFTSGALAGQTQLITNYAFAASMATFTSNAFSAAPAVGDSFEILQAATGRVILSFASPLPDDRITLTVNDSVRDAAGNWLDGESDANQPQGGPTWPSGDGVPGGDFVARFNVDSRPEIGVVCCNNAYIDTNGNFVFDPQGQDNDATNRDLNFSFSALTDGAFAGKFTPTAASTTNGFDKLGAYGYSNGRYRFQLDTNDDGVLDQEIVSTFQVNAIAVAGNFDGNLANGDEIGLFDGVHWYLDTTADNTLNLTVSSALRGVPVVGDFDGDGRDDLAAFDQTANRFSFDLFASGGYNGSVDDSLAFGFSGRLERPVAGDLNLDGIDDLGLWAPDRNGTPPLEDSEWFFLVSDNPGAGVPSAVFEQYSPTPLGNDVFAQFGDQYGLPIFGNFDPPVANGEDVPDSGAPADGNEQSSGDGQNNGNDQSSNSDGSPAIEPVANVFTNQQNRLDVNANNRVEPFDVLLIANVLNATDVNPPVPVQELAEDVQFVDVSGDGLVSAYDALLVVNALNAPQGGEAEGGEAEGEHGSASQKFDSVVDYIVLDRLPDESSPLQLRTDKQIESSTSIDQNVGLISESGADKWRIVADAQSDQDAIAAKTADEVVSDRLEQLLAELASDVATEWYS